ncbi:hypothetical protein [Micromonospora sp. RTGN7]|uniref:hypothetical protein n=1 Tax=Micromonospora sp. RTGN7 TaxID=3016526 RepID=UPI0029FF2C84|nr:hypothetical protein [Micromonospora sp. RTGN7]
MLTIAVNATPFGLNPDDPLPFRPHFSPPGTVVAGIMANPGKRGFSVKPQRSGTTSITESNCSTGARLIPRFLPG